MSRIGQGGVTGSESPKNSPTKSKLLRKSSLGKSRTIRWLKQKYPSFENNGKPVCDIETV